MPRMAGRLLLAISCVFALAAAEVRAQPQAHPGEYAPADIAYGARLYDAQCTTCHGANGDGVGGVDLRSGKFRNAVTDQDLDARDHERHPGHRHAGVQVRRGRAGRHRRVSAQHEHLRPRLGEAGRRGPRADAVRRARRLPALPSRRRAGFARRAGPERHRRDPERRVASTLADRSEQPDDADQPAGPRRHHATARVINGRRLNEDTYTVQLIDDQERLVSLTKADLREYTS